MGRDGVVVNIVVGLCMSVVCAGRLGVCFIVFFFKQKTAYEILTCDWSSDVCSSDLPMPTMNLNQRLKAWDKLLKGKVKNKEKPAPTPSKIGRASCRERV